MASPGPASDLRPSSTQNPLCLCSVQLAPRRESLTLQRCRPVSGASREPRPWSYSSELVLVVVITPCGTEAAGPSGGFGGEMLVAREEAKTGCWTGGSWVKPAGQSLEASRRFLLLVGWLPIFPVFPAEIPGWGDMSLSLLREQPQDFRLGSQRIGCLATS